LGVKGTKRVMGTGKKKDWALGGRLQMLRRDNKKRGDSWYTAMALTPKLRKKAKNAL